jgi:hypothetical protein
VASRERKRAERRKRKARGASQPPQETAEVEGVATSAAAAGVEAEAPQGPMQRGYAKAEQRNREARETLEPLREDERPLVVTLGAVISALIAISILIGYVSGVKVNGDRPQIAQVLSPALLVGVMAWGMWKARYWAVLGFQTILVFLIAAAAFGLLLQAQSAAQIAADVGLLAVAGTFFYFMVKAMARIQMPHRLPRD